MKPLSVLVACEKSGVVRDAFIARGHYAMSCDIEPTETPGPHYQGDVRDVLCAPWDILIAHPECTYLSRSGWHWVTRGRIEADGRPRIEHVKEALAFARMFIDGPETAHIPKRAVENPVGRLSTLVRKPDQIIQPYDFGNDASKATCLWLHGLRPLVPTGRFPGRRVMWKGKEVERWSNQTDSGQNILGPSTDRQRERGKTYAGIGAAMADQWGGGLV